MNIDELIDNFEFLDGWEDKYRYIIDLGGKLEPLPENCKTEEWKVRGCQSQVWLLPEKKDGLLHFRGDSDAIIVKGLIAIVLMIYNDKSPSQIKSIAVDDIFAPADTRAKVISALDILAGKRENTLPRKHSVK